MPPPFRRAEGRVVGPRLAQLDQHAVCGAGMDKGDQTALGAGTRLRAGQFYARRDQLRQEPANVVYLEADMVDALAAIGEELLHRPLVAGWLQQLDPA